MSVPERMPLMAIVLLASVGCAATASEEGPCGEKVYQANRLYGLEYSLGQRMLGYEDDRDVENSANLAILVAEVGSAADAAALEAILCLRAEGITPGAEYSRNVEALDSLRGWRP